MKRFLTTLFCFSIPMMLLAQQYKIYSVQGDVLVQRATDTAWGKADVYASLAPNDMIRTKNGGSVTIHEIATGRLYSSTQKGSLSLQRRIEIAQKEEKTLFSALNRELRRAVSKNKHKPMPAYSASANSVRGLGAQRSPSVYDSVYACILDCCNDQTGFQSEDIIVEKIVAADGSFFFTIQNNTDKIHFCNLLFVNDSSVSFCCSFDESGFLQLPAGYSADLSAFRFFNNDGYYIFLASEKPLSIQPLQDAFSSVPPQVTSTLPFITLFRL